MIVDVAVDQGGCVETIRPTSHSEPTYVLHRVLHYGVPNMPALVPRSSTLALTNATLPYLLALAVATTPLDACRRNHALSLGVNTHAGSITHPVVAEALGREFATL